MFRMRYFKFSSCVLTAHCVRRRQKRTAQRRSGHVLVAQRRSVVRTHSAVPDVVQLRACQNPPSLITDSTGHPTSVEQPFDGQVDCGFFQNKGDVSQRNRTTSASGLRSSAKSTLSSPGGARTWSSRPCPCQACYDEHLELMQQCHNKVIDAIKELQDIKVNVIKKNQEDP
ncbi:uncharacterized protein LOC144150075 [Haemaphysalis longicornis]